MATYLQGVTDYIPQIQPWTPDYNFYQGALQRKQQQYDMGWEKMNTLYNSLLNAPMTRDDNIGKRDQFFQNIEQDINRLSGIDLSKPQNVDAASQLFNPLIQDKYIVNDIGWTKKYNNERERAEYFRNCTDPKKCGGKYWDEGVRALDYMRSDFRQVDADQALQMGAPKYVPYTNAVEKAFDKIKDQKFGTKIQRISEDGRWIITEKNGQNMVEPLTSYLATTLGNDPAVVDMYKTKAYVQRKDWLVNNGRGFENENAAEAAYYQQFVQPSVNDMERVNNDIRDARKDREVELNAFERIINLEGVIPGSEEHKKYQQVNEEFNKITAVEEQSDKDLENARNITKSDNPATMRINSDAAVASSLFFNDMLQTAINYHELTYEQEMKAEPYALAAYKEDLSFKYGVRKDELADLLDRETWLWKKEKEWAREDKLVSGSHKDNTTLTEDSGEYQEDSDTDPTKEDSYEKNQEFKAELEGDLMHTQAKFLSDVYNGYMAMDPKDVDNLGWTWDFTQIYGNTGGLKKMYGKDWNKYKSVSGDGLVRKLQGDGKTYMTPEDFQKLPAAVIDKMYRAARKQMDPEIGVNDKKSYNAGIWNQLSESPEGEVSLLDQLMMEDELVKLYKNTQGKMWNGDPDAVDPTMTEGLKKHFYNLVMNGDATITPGHEGYHNEATGNQIAFNNVPGLKKKAFLDAAIEEFTDENGEIVPFNIFQERMLRRGISWYKQPKKPANINKEPVPWDGTIPEGYEARTDSSGTILKDFNGFPLLSDSAGVLTFHPETVNPFQVPELKNQAGMMGADDWFTDPWGPISGGNSSVPYYKYNSDRGTKSYIENVGMGADGMYYEETQEIPNFDLPNFVPDGKGGFIQSKDTRSPQERTRDLWEQDVIEASKKTLHQLYYGQYEERGGEKGKKDIGLDDIHFKMWSRDPRAQNMKSYLGGGSGGTTGLKAVHKDIDPASYSSVHMRYSQSLFDELNANAGELEFADDWMSSSKGREILKEFSNHAFDNKWKTTDKNRPRFTVKYLSETKDPNKVKVQLYFDRGWIEANDGSKASPGLTRKGDKTLYELADKGMTILAPKNLMSNNLYEQSSKQDVMDMIVKSRGHYDWKEKYPLAGDFQIKYDRNKLTYYTTGNIQYYDDNGKLIKTPIPREQNEWMNDPLITFSAVKAHWEPMIKDLHDQNKAYELWQKSQFGETDPEKLK
jgi:hypothetical protein